MTVFGILVIIAAGLFTVSVCMLTVSIAQAKSIKEIKRSVGWSVAEARAWLEEHKPAEWEIDT